VVFIDGRSQGVEHHNLDDAKAWVAEYLANFAALEAEYAPTIITTIAPWAAYEAALARTPEGGRKNYGDWSITGGNGYPP
jgi:hypothetical protein